MTVRTQSAYYRWLIAERKCLEKFSAGHGCCIVCFNSNPMILEEHHPFGKANSAFTLTVCANHHTLLSRMQRSWPDDWLKNSRKAVEVIKAIQDRALGNLLKVTADYVTGVDHVKH